MREDGSFCKFCEGKRRSFHFHGIRKGGRTLPLSCAFFLKMRRKYLLRIRKKGGPACPFFFEERKKERPAKIAGIAKEFRGLGGKALRMMSGTRIAGRFLDGIQDAVPIAIGYIPIALTYGFIAKSTGLSLGECLLMSLFVYAGASQYMALDMIGKHIGSLEIIFTTFIVNIRHFLMSASLNEKVEKDHPLKKAIYAFGVTDETFSVAAVKNEKLTTLYMYGLNVLAYFSWCLFSAVGFIIGSNIPGVFQDGMSIALYAMFIGLLVPSMKKSGKVLFLAGSAAFLNSFFQFCRIVSPGWSIVIATLAASVFVEYVFWLKRKRGKVRNG